MWEMFLTLRLLMAVAPGSPRRGTAKTIQPVQAFTGATRLAFGAWRLSLDISDHQQLHPADGDKIHDHKIIA
ncbi:hypothetical protein G6N74_10000 [Mesorhizobium sp. CGMCC 1.15528]|uniref:Uncharacterized protein n=1 Tax=Mesorhizobium zhangyense TaxID=1776730 RepID=A0A7C9R6Y1_9HYPH|nr:hypothetical protein [Mesorhizobium zhangyense]NGN41399.1 hypothetical protein [Mesorhizobium zhangyense]